MSINEYVKALEERLRLLRIVHEKLSENTGRLVYLEMGEARAIEKGEWAFSMCNLPDKPNLIIKYDRHGYTYWSDKTAIKRETAEEMLEKNYGYL